MRFNIHEAAEFTQIFDKHIEAGKSVSEAFKATSAEWIELEGDRLFKDYAQFYKYRYDLKKRSKDRADGFRITERAKEVTKFVALVMRDGDDRTSYDDAESLWLKLYGKRCFKDYNVYYQTKWNYLRSGKFEAIKKVS